MVTMDPEAVEKAAREAVGKPGVLRNAASTAWNATTEVPGKVLKSGGELTQAIAKNKVGAFLLTGAAMIAAGLGIKSWAEKRDERHAQEAAIRAPEFAELKQNIQQNRAKLAETSAELGQYNRQGNFRETVRGGGMAQGGQPDLNN